MFSVTFKCSMPNGVGVPCSSRTAVRAMMAPAAKVGPLGGYGVTVEADDMEMGKSPNPEAPGGRKGKRSSFEHCERGGTNPFDHNRPSRQLARCSMNHFDASPAGDWTRRTCASSHGRTAKA